MLKVGITGSFGAGKSLVAAMFKARGARVIDADAIGHAVLNNDPACLRSLVKAFGPGIAPAGVVDRARLGKIVFDDPLALKKLEAIVHPRMRRIIVKEMAKGCGNCGMVVLDAAILIEKGWDRLLDLVIVVRARRDVQIRRVMARTGLLRTDVLKRIRRQMPLREKLKYAAHVIDNSGSAAKTEEHVERIFRSLKNPPSKRSRHHD